MKSLVLWVLGMTAVGAACCLLIAIRNDAFTSEQLEKAFVVGFGILTGLVFALLACLPLSWRVRRVKNVRGSITHGPYTVAERRRNRRLWVTSAAILAAEILLVGWWQILDGGDPVLTTWVLGTLAICYFLGTLISHPIDLPQVNPRMSVPAIRQECDRQWEDPSQLRLPLPTES